MRHFLITDAEIKLVLQILLHFQGIKGGRGGVSIETVLNFCLQFTLLNTVDKLLILIAK